MAYWELVWSSWTNKGENAEERTDSRIIMKQKLSVWRLTGCECQRKKKVSKQDPDFFFNLRGLEMLSLDRTISQQDSLRRNT